MGKTQERPGFVLYLSNIDIMEESLTGEEALGLLSAIKNYIRTGEMTELTGSARICFSFMKEQVEIQARKYGIMCEQNSQNARARWAKVKDGPEAASQEKTAEDLPASDAEEIPGTGKDAKESARIFSDAKETDRIFTDANGSEKCQINKTKENQTKENQTKLNQTKPNGSGIAQNLPERTVRDQPSGGGERRLSGAEEAAFERFWALYPRKHNKPEAYRLFGAALKTVSAEKLLEAVEKQIRSRDWQKEDGRFIPHPVKWLQEHGWENVPPPAFEDRYVLLNPEA